MRHSPPSSKHDHQDAWHNTAEEHILDTDFGDNQ